MGHGAEEPRGSREEASGTVIMSLAKTGSGFSVQGTGWACGGRLETQPGPSARGGDLQLRPDPRPKRQ